ARQPTAMSMPPMFTATNSVSSRRRAVRRVAANVQRRLPIQANRTETATETTFAVNGLSPSSSPGPKRSRLNRPTSTTYAIPPTAQNRSTSASHAPRLWPRRSRVANPAGAVARAGASGRSAVTGAAAGGSDLVTRPSVTRLGSVLVSAPVVAVVGGGQLARMMQQQAIALGIHLRVLVESPTVATAQVVPDAPVGAASDSAAVRGIVDGAAVLTFEHEHVPGDLLGALVADGVPVRPGPDALVHAQDKIVMARRLGELGAPCPAGAAVATPAELDRFGDETGWPVVVKTARGGYDGKGVRVVASAAEAADWLDALEPGQHLLAEERVPFVRELAVLVARRPSGEVRTWPVVQ